MIRNCDTCKYRKYKDEMYPCNNCVVWDGKTLFYTLWRDGDPLVPPDTCEWTYRDYDGYYDTQCDRAFQLSDGDLSENPFFKFCPFCGQEIKVKEKEIEILPHSDNKSPVFITRPRSGSADENEYRKRTSENE